MDMFDGRKVFSVYDGQGMNTLAFQINKNMDNGVEILSIEKLKSFIESVQNGYRKTFFFNPEPADEELKEIVFLTIKPGEAILNAGDFKDGILHVGKKPGNIKYSSIKITGDESEYKEFQYTPNFKRPIAIVDPILGDEVKPVVFFDTNTNSMKARMKILPHKSYIAIEVVK
ncbi:MAG: hypothetical protein IKI57_03450 [Clostridia bacterium]|nr:hypothetical protein [Clostridia bacterium]